MKKSLSLIIGGMVALLIFYNGPSLYQDLQVHFSYQKTMCSILAKDLRYNKQGYFPQIQISYMEYQHPIGYPLNKWVPASRIHSVTQTESYAREILSRYKINTQITCWQSRYDSNNIVLEQGVHWRDWIISLTALIFLLLIVCVEYLTKIQSNNAIEKTQTFRFPCKPGCRSILAISHLSLGTAFFDAPKGFEGPIRFDKIMPKDVNVPIIHPDLETLVTYSVPLIQYFPHFKLGRVRFG